MMEPYKTMRADKLAPLFVVRNPVVADPGTLWVRPADSETAPTQPTRATHVVTCEKASEELLRYQSLSWSVPQITRPLY